MRVAVDEIHFNTDVLLQIDIQKTFGHIYHCNGNAIVCGDEDAGSYISAHGLCGLKWERDGKPCVYVDISEFAELATQAKPMPRWRHSLLEAERREREKASKPKATTRRRITENDRRAIRRLSKEGMQNKEIASKIGISQATVSRVLRAVGKARKRSKANAA